MTIELQPRTKLRVVSLFSGISGGDLGLEKAGHSVVEMCESWAPARRVLESHYPHVHIAPDVREYSPDLEFELLSAGFPCVDLSHAGTQTGIFGPQSGLVEHVFRIAKLTSPEWILIENVPNLLRLHKGAGIRYIIESLEALGYKWAYRVLDSRAFGVPQRRNRVIILASRHGDPAGVLLGEDFTPDSSPEETVVELSKASGFYWTEGRRGVGLVADAIPTLKGGSTLGLPSAPAVWKPHAPLGRRIVLPSIEDAEALQGFERGWTEAAETATDKGNRWKLVGNAVTVGLGEWLGSRLAQPSTEYVTPLPLGERDISRPWPDAAFGAAGQIWLAKVSRLPRPISGPTLDEVLDSEGVRPLSYRATKGFLSRIEESGLTLPDRFMADLEGHLASMRVAINQRASAPQSWASSPAVRARMHNTKSKNTTPEILLRRALTDRGVRYRLQTRSIPDLRWRSDLVFKGARVAVEVRGCFWHVCPVHQTWPKANADRWSTKLVKNQERDRRMEQELADRGWEVIVVWEHEDPEVAAQRVIASLDARKSVRATPVRPAAEASVG